jgi:hypothetical protein
MHFCSGTPVTAEHIWPDWARRMLPGDVIATHTVRADTPAARSSHTFRQRVFDHRVKVVCAGCNNGWMSRLEKENQPFLEAALNGRGRVLHRDGQRALAAWAFKTVLVINRGLFRAHRTGLPPAHAHHLLSRGEPPSDVGIWLTAFTADEPAYVMSTGLALSGPGERVTDEDSPNFSIVTFTFGPLVFQVAGAVDPSAIGIVPAEINFPWAMIHRLWPYRGSFTWTPTPALDNRSLDAFANRIREELQRLTGS